VALGDRFFVRCLSKVGDAAVNARILGRYNTLMWMRSEAAGFGSNKPVPHGCHARYEDDVDCLIGSGGCGGREGWWVRAEWSVGACALSGALKAKRRMLEWGGLASGADAVIGFRWRESFSECQNVPIR